MPLDERIPGPPPETPDPPAEPVAKPSSSAEDTAPVPEATADSSGGEAPDGSPIRREDNISRKFNALRRQKQQVAHERAQWENDRKAFDQERVEFQRQVEALRQARAEAQRNPEEWLKQGGLDKNHVDTFYKTREGQPAHDARFDKISYLEEQLAERDKRLERLEKTQNAFNESRFVERVERDIRGNAEFELINHFERYDAVAQLVALTYQKSGEWISTQAAAARIENLLEKQNEAEIRRALASQKLAKRLGWQPESQSGDTAAEETPATNVKAPVTKPKKPGERKRPPVEPTLSNDAKWEKIMERVR